jgi:hypothetical protein
MSNIYERFINLFNKSAVISYNDEWLDVFNNFSKAMNGKHSPSLHIGEMKLAIDKEHRRILIIGTSVGNIVIFELGGNENKHTLIANIPRSIVIMLQIENSMINEKDLILLTGDDRNITNFGLRFMRFMSAPIPMHVHI